MRVTHRLLWLTGCVTVVTDASARVLANVNWYPAPTAFAPDVPIEVLKARSPCEIIVAEQATESRAGEVRKVPTPGRFLQQAGPRVTSVKTGQELIDAVVGGAQHVRIEQHLDLTLPSLEAQIHPISDADTTFQNFYRYVGYINTNRTDTVMGACGGPVPLDVQAAIANGTAPLNPLDDNQCLLLVDQGGFQVLGDGNVWLDNLYIRKVATARTHRWGFSLLTAGQWDAPYRTTVSPSSESEPFALIGPPRVYLTGLRLQGDGVHRIQNSSSRWEYQSTIGLGVAAPTYVSGCSITDAGGRHPTVLVHSSSVHIVNTTITDNERLGVTDGTSDRTAILTVENASLWLEGTEVRRNDAAVVMRTLDSTTGVIVTDTPSEYITQVQDGVGDVGEERLHRTKAHLQPPPQSEFMTGTEEWFLSTAQAYPDRPAPSSAFQPADVADDTANVAAAEELVQALQQGRRRIVVTQHLDLTALKPLNFEQERVEREPEILGIVPDATHSITGDCTEAPPAQILEQVRGVPLVPLTPGQCLLVTDKSLFYLGAGRLWMHNLYLRHTATNVSYPVVTMVGPSVLNVEAQLWMTSCTLQGYGQYDSGFGASGLTLRSKAYVEGSQIRSLGGSVEPVFANSTELRLVNSSVSDNFVQSPYRGVIRGTPAASVWLENTSILSNQAVVLLSGPSDPDLRANPAVFHSDVRRTVLRDLRKNESQPPPTDPSSFLSSTSAWFVDVKKALPPVVVQSQAQSEEDAVDPVEVTTGEELVSAVARGRRHIRVVDHVDLRLLSPPWAGSRHNLGFVPWTTRSITGNCEAPPPAALLSAEDVAAWRPGQCVVVVDSYLLQVMYSSLWLDSLFISLQRTSRTGVISAAALITVGDNNATTADTDAASGALWLTRSVVSGDTDAVGTSARNPVTAVTVQRGSSAALHGVRVQRTGGPPTVAMYVAGHLLLDNCTLSTNVAGDDGGGVVYATGESASVLLNRVAVRDNVGQRVLANSDGSTMYSTQPGLQQFGEFASEASPLAPAGPEQAGIFLDFADPWLVATVEELGYSMRELLPDVITGIAPVPGEAAPVDVPFISPVEAPSSPTFSGVDYTDYELPEVDNEYTVVIEDAPSAPVPSTSPGNTGGLGCADEDCGSPVVGPQGPSANATPPIDPEGIQPGSGTIRSGLATKNGGESSSADSSNGEGIIAGVTGSAAVILCIIAAAAAFVIGRRKRRKRASGGSPAAAAARPPGADKPVVFEQHGVGAYGMPDQLYAPQPVPPHPQHMLPWQDRQPQLMRAPAPPQPPLPPLQHRQAPGETALRDHIALPVPPVATGLTSTAVSAHARSGATSSAGNGSAHASRSGTAHSVVASVASTKQRLQFELVGMCDSEELFMGAYRVLSPQEQREGGQGVVQFMRWARTEEPVAVKFFLSQATFDEEMQLYAEASLRSMMPVMREAMRAGEVKSRSGYMFPAFAVLERGESLQDWRRNVLPQTATVVDALTHIAKKLEQLHASGWVHRDIKPGNILRLPKVHGWTLMDFGCAARTGDSKFLAYTLHYAPPEVIRAKERGQSHLVVAEATDIWALGLIAFELLAEVRAFDMLTEADIVECLCGRRPLLWEEAGPDAATRLAKLGVLRTSVLACLQRDPSQRPTAFDLRRSWERVFDQQTVTGPATWA